MDIIDVDGENKDEEANSHWSPFEQHIEQNNTTKAYQLPRCTEETAVNLISFVFAGQGKLDYDQIRKTDDKVLSKNLDNDEHTASCTCCMESFTTYRCHLIGCEHYFKTWQSKEYWNRVSYSSMKKKGMNKRTMIWNQNYLALLPLNLLESYQNLSKETWDNSTIRNNGHHRNEILKAPFLCNFILSSDDSDSDESEELVENYCDPIYSRFGVIRNAFHTSEDGIVFYSQEEAKRAEQRKLLSDRIDSQEADSQEEDVAMTENDALNTDNNKQKSTKQERKSAIFSSIHDVFSYARTGIQGMFVKNSPNSGRKMRSNNDDSDESEDEPTVDGVNLPKQDSSTLEPDNHDEFSRQMTSEGGLKYKSGDESVQQLSYQNLPPPLSLTTLPHDAKTKS